MNNPPPTSITLGLNNGEKVNAMQQNPLENGADVNAKDKNYRTNCYKDLMKAIKRGHSSMVRLLVNHGLDIKAPDDNDNLEKLLND